MIDATDASALYAERRLGAVLNQKYRLERLIGVGGMAAVYLATHRNANQVAIKMLHRELSLDPEARSRFLLEGYAANKLGHPGAVRVLDDDVAEDGSAFLVMELLEGETYDDRTAAAGHKLPHRDVMDMAHALLDVLAAAADHGIVHRDIKPQNLFATRSGALKVLDFGLARLADTRAAHATRSGQVFGTPAFMPPEQALGKAYQIDHRTDIWSVGATMFTLLSGRFVHVAETPAEQLVFTASRPAPSLAEAAPGTPKAIVDIVDRALQFAREDRWQSARDMQRAIEEAYAPLYGAPPPPRRGARASRPGTPARAAKSGLSELETIPQTRPRPRLRREALWIGAAIAAAVTAIALWSALRGGEGDGDALLASNGLGSSAAVTAEAPAVSASATAGDEAAEDAAAPAASAAEEAPKPSATPTRPAGTRPPQTHRPVKPTPSSTWDTQ